MMRKKWRFVPLSTQLKKVWTLSRCLFQSQMPWRSLDGKVAKPIKNGKSQVPNYYYSDYIPWVTFKSVCFFPLNLLHQRDVLNRKIPETIYYILLISFNGIKIQKHIASPAAVPGTCAGSCTSNLVSVRKINVWNFPMVGLCKLKAQMPANHWWLGCHVNFVPRLTLHESIWSNWRKNAHILTLLIFVYRIQLHDFQDISRISTSLPGLLWISPCFDWQTLRRSWWEIFCQELSC